MFRIAKTLSFVYGLIDATFLVGSFYFSAFLLKIHVSVESQFLLAGGLVLFWLLASQARKIYTSNLHNGLRPRINAYAEAYITFAIFVIAIVYLGPNFPFVDGKLVLTAVSCFVSIDFIVNAILIRVISEFRRRRTKNVVIAGAGDLAAKITNYIDFNPDFGFSILGYLQDKKEEKKVDEEKVAGSVKDLGQYLETNQIDEIIVALPYRSSQKKIQKIINHADFYGVRVSYVPDFQGLFGNNFKLVHDGRLEAVNVRQLPLDEVYAAIVKQLFDIVFAGFVLLVLSPVLLAISIAIKLDSPGPVFYCPIRTGRGGRNFKVYKFRTMYENDSTSNGTLSTKKDDPRITRLGRILRKYSLDELPQFINVLIGDMSVVGPRPHRNFLNKQMQEHVSKYMLRYYFRPGITGWAQVNGWRGPTETEEQIAQRTAYDLWYIEHWSFFLDVKIIFMTVFGKKTYQNAF